MKLEHVLVLHLYNNKQITLQGIGTFRLDSSVSLPADPEREITLPANAITFNYDPKAKEDESLVDAIVQHTNKIKPLASADLDSYLMLGRQFMNIGKPFTLEGIGTLEKKQGETLDFKAGQHITQKLEAPKSLKENEMEESSGLFNDYNKPREDNSKKIIAIISIIVVLGLVAAAIYYFVLKQKNNEPNDTVTQPKQTIIPDTLAQKRDTQIANNNSGTSIDSANNNDYTFRIVIGEYNNRQAALNSMNRSNSWGGNVIMYTTDSIHYKLAELFKTPLSDTIRVKEFYNKYYKGKVYVEVR